MGEPHGAYETYPSQRDGVEISSYFVAPEARNWPAPTVLVLRGIAGPDSGYTDIADRIATSGYAALVHHWQARGNDPQDDVLIEDIRSGLSFLRARPEVDYGRLAAFGYCKGGGQAVIAAANCPEIRAVIAFHGFARRPHGGGPERQDPIEFVERVQRPVLLLHGEQDQLSPVASMLQLCDALRLAGAPVEVHTYNGAEHGFAVSTHKGYSEYAARDSFGRALNFLERIFRQEGDEPRSAAGRRRRRTNRISFSN